MVNNQLKITYVKLVNHVVLGNIEFELDNDIVSILGKNGAGKSFLMDTLQPYSRSNRFINNYPVVQGATGYKQVNFITADGITYETIHEYVPKGKSHACKSYLNKVVNGIKIELNPTGHCDKYDELIRHHLNFDSSCMIVGFLSFKANGITSSRGQERKKILESTIDNPILRMFKRNAKELASEHNTMAKQYEKQKMKLASQYTEESLDEDINKLTIGINENKKLLATATENLNKYISKKNELELISNTDTKKISMIRDISLDGLKYGTVYEMYNKYQDSLKRSEINSNEIFRIREQINRYESYTSLKQALSESESVLKEKSDKLRSLNDKLSKYIIVDKRNNVIPWLENIVQMAKHFTDTLRGISVMAVSSDNLDKIISELVERKKNNEEFILKYKVALSNTDGNRYEVNFQDNCNTCQLYSKFVKSDEFVTKNKSKWSNIVDVEQPDIEYKIQKLNLIKENIKSSLYNSIIQCSQFIQDPDKAGLSNVDKFLQECSNDVLYPKLVRLLDWIKGMNNFIDVLNDDIADLNITIKDTEMKLSNIDVDSNLAIDKYKDQLNTLTEKAVEYDRVLTGTIFKVVGALDMSDPDILKYSTMSFDELDKLYTVVNRSESDLKFFNSKIDYLEKEISSYPKVIESSIIEKTQLESKLKDLKNLNKNLVDYDRKRKVFARCKDLLDKEIPITLLRNNLQFIEKTTNAILANNSIPMSVNIIPSDSEITIEVTVRDKTINDAVQLSAGETAIISLLLNACVLHIIGYPIICLDEIDSNLDLLYRRQFNDLIYSIMTVLQISQIFCISHNIASNINYATKILVGDDKGLDLNSYDCTSLIRL